MIGQIFDPAKPVFVVGGGASLRDFDWTLLEGRQVLAVNTAFRKLPNATAMFFADRNFYGQWKDLHPRQDFWRFGGEIFTSLEDFSDHPRIKTLVLGVTGNSGVQAIDAAQTLGAEKIVLLGFDGKPGHWHDGTSEAHRFAPPEAAVYERYNAEFKQLSGDIVNATPGSAIDAFPLEPLSTYIKGA